MLRAATSLIAPPLCGICGEACDPRELACRSCWRQLDRERPRLTTLPGGLEVFSTAGYDGIARQLVAKMKYRSRIGLAEVAAERMVRTLGASRSVWMVSVPPSPARERARGFDGAYVLARLIAERTVGCSQVSPCLARDEGPPQVGRTRAKRLANPPRIRLLSDKVRLPSDDLWLVDDVVTTGATLMSCADVLFAAGARRVRALTFACADSDSFGHMPVAA